MKQLPDIRALIGLPFDAHSKITGISSLENPRVVRQLFDEAGLWWVVPFAFGASGCHYGFRLAPGEENGAVLRCLDGHAVTIASTPDRAILSVLALERLLVGDKSRAKLQDGWQEVRGLLREAATITGGEPDALDEMLHVADDLPKWISPTTADAEEKRREMLRRITGEAKPDSGSNNAWMRANDSLITPENAEASLRLLQGNHGLDGTHAAGGLMPGSKPARELLVACARSVRTAGLAPDEAWRAVIDALADREEPTPDDFIPTAVGVGAVRAWDGLAAASFWFNAVGGSVPSEHSTTAEEIADAAGAQHILEARRLLDVRP